MARAVLVHQHAGQRDISRLDPESENIAEGGWGGLTDFSGWVGDIVSQVANRDEGS